MSGPRLALLANPESGDGEAASAARLVRERGGDVAVFGLDDADSAMAARPARLAVAGGDGSLAGAAAAAARAGIPLAVIPTGTANDFAHALGIPTELERAVELALAGDATRRLDIAWMDERPFLNVASAGLAPAAARRAAGLKGALGPLAYIVGGVRAGLFAHPVRCAVRCDGAELFAGRAWQASVACTGAFGAGSSLAADPADGRVDVVVIEAGSRLRLARHAYGLRGGELEEQPGVRNARAGSVELDVPAGTSFNVDGEVVRSGSCRFRVDPRAVEVVVA